MWIFHIEHFQNEFVQKGSWTFSACICCKNVVLAFVPFDSCLSLLFFSLSYGISLSFCSRPTCVVDILGMWADFLINQYRISSGVFDSLSPGCSLGLINIEMHRNGCNGYQIDLNKWIQGSFILFWNPWILGVKVSRFITCVLHTSFQCHVDRV